MTEELSKYRGLIQSLDPKIVFVEETADTLQTSIAVACLDSLQNLIFVDNMSCQRGFCMDEELAGDPYVSVLRLHISRVFNRNLRLRRSSRKYCG